MKLLDLEFSEDVISGVAMEGVSDYLLGGSFYCMVDFTNNKTVGTEYIKRSLADRAVKELIVALTSEKESLRLLGQSFDRDRNHRMRVEVELSEEHQFAEYCVNKRMYPTAQARRIWLAEKDKK